MPRASSRSTRKTTLLARVIVAIPPVLFTLPSNAADAAVGTGLELRYESPHWLYIRGPSSMNVTSFRH